MRDISPWLLNHCLVMSVINAMEQRYFCVTQASKLTLKFELPPPSATLMTIPTLFALNGQADIAINLMSIIEQGLAFPEFVEYQTITTRLNEFIIHLGKLRQAKHHFHPHVTRGAQGATFIAISARIYAGS